MLEFEAIKVRVMSINIISILRLESLDCLIQYSIKRNINQLNIKELIRYRFCYS